MNTTVCSLALRSIAALFVAVAAAAESPRFTGPWDVERLRQPPAATWGVRTGLVQAVHYQGEPFQGRSTRVFAWLGRPPIGSGPFPAMLLVHGGGGRAFPDWAEHWAQRGYVALAMDLSGNGPDGRLADGGPDQDDGVKFRDFTDADLRDMWTYHAIAAILRGHGLLRSQPGVDPRRLGITGISWGGYLTCIAAGVDDQLAVAVPVYGCGFLSENSCWLEPRFAPMTEEQRRRWVKYFDPASYLGEVRCPILFLNGANDFAYPLDSYRKSFACVPGRKTLSVIIDLPHGHLWNFGEVDWFVDSVLRGGAPLAELKPLQVAGHRATAAFRSRLPIVKAEFHFTTDAGAWQQRKWKSVPAEIAGNRVVADLPAERPLTGFVSVLDPRGLTVSTPHVELPATAR